MVKHLTDSDIAGILAGYKNDKYIRHLSSCPACLKKMKEAEKILQPVQGIEKIFPSPSVKARLLSSYRAMESGKNTGRWNIPLPLAGLAGALTIIAIVTTFLVIRTAEPDAVPMNISMTLLPGKTVTAISENSSILVEKNSRAVINRIDDMILSLAPGSEIRILTASVNSKSGNETFSMKLDKGILAADFIHRPARKYSIITPHGKLDSIGTRFILSVEPESTEVFLEEGSLQLVKQGGRKETIAQGSHWLMSDTSLQSMPPDHDKQKILHSAFDKTTGTEQTAPLINKTVEPADRDGNTSPLMEKHDEADEQTLINSKKSGQKEKREFYRFRQEQKTESLQEWKKMKREIQQGK